MKKVLILTEKRSVSSHISKALKNVSDDITITEIGGHIYTTDEPFVVPYCEMKSLKALMLKNYEKGYIRGEPLIKENIKKIERMLSENNFDIIVNACDNDKNGKALFSFACDLLNISEQDTVSIELSDLQENYIYNQYLNVCALKEG